jgi:plasmid stabilization system protein ParE
VARVVHSSEAIEDLARLWQFLREAAPEHADTALAEILVGIDILATHPLVGRRVEGEKRELVVSRGVTGYVILYVFDPVGEVVLVLRARHQRECGFSD